MHLLRFLWKKIFENYCIFIHQIFLFVTLKIEISAIYWEHRNKFILLQFDVSWVFFLTRLDLWHHLVITLHPFLEKILGSSSTFMIFLTFRYSRCLPDQSCFLIGRNSKISEITCLMELLHNWNVRYLDLQNICVFLFAKIPRWPPPQDKFNTWPYGKHISKSLLSETTEQFDRIFDWNVPLMVISKLCLFYGNQKFMMAATTVQILI